jgi:hypothetical protein
MYSDEFYSMDVAKNMLSGEVSERIDSFYRKSPGWPFVLSLIFSLFGLNNFYAIITAMIFGCLTVFISYFIVYLITKDRLIGLSSSIMVAFLPMYVNWSSSADNTAPSLFFMCLSIFFCLLYHQNGKELTLWLAAISLAFSSQFRAENYFVAGMFFLVYFIYEKKVFTKIDFKSVLPFLAFIILVTFDLIFFLAIFNPSACSIHKGITTIFQHGVEVYLFKFVLFPTMIIVALIGGIILFKRNKKSAAFLILSLFYLPTLLVYANLLDYRPTLDYFRVYNRFYFLLSYLVIILMSIGFMKLKESIGISKFKNALFAFIACIILIFSWNMALNYNNFHNPYLILESKLPNLMKTDFSNETLIVMPYPEILATTYFENRAFLGDIYRNSSILKSSKETLFVEDMTCTFFSTGDICTIMKKEYKLENIKNYTLRDANYKVYKVISKVE